MCVNCQKYISIDNYKMKPYKHIDRPIRIQKAKSYVMSPTKVAKHSFLPFISYVLSNEKWTGIPNNELEGRPIKIKERQIMYAGHFDSYIYKYYSQLLNCKYTDYLKQNNLDRVATAYRNNKSGESNINFAAEVINFIKQQPEAWIYVGDFEKYFDTLDHELLKTRLKTILDTSYLSDDWYNIFKSLTKFGYYDREALDNYQNTQQEAFKGQEKRYFYSLKEFRTYQKFNKCSYNKQSFGIPQGTSISPVLANIYAIDFDQSMQEIAAKYNGIYRRYSDDFILVLPKLRSDYDQERVIKIIEQEAKINKIKINSDKSQKYYFINNDLLKLAPNSMNAKGHLDYLGFIFDGKNVRMRNKSVQKFYRKTKRTIGYAKWVKYDKNLKKLPYRKVIYNLYTDMGLNYKTYGNFINYTKRAQRIFDANSPNTNNLMMQQLSNRKKKIEKYLGYKIHIKL
ncbi:hypothetical protein HMPREF2626_03525 [Aerococcus sp. HMSC062A02]|nr:hypothetical protein HMPREF2626_03525 [Aerococcus sp. HMSC062A02]OHO42766.1 hypothetical protein HMPREF2705_02570 [Aerococcus sp. HMSC035B07]